jgi:hypothetical protein
LRSSYFLPRYCGRRSSRLTTERLPSTSIHGYATILRQHRNVGIRWRHEHSIVSSLLVTSLHFLKWTQARTTREAADTRCDLTTTCVTKSATSQESCTSSCWATTTESATSYRTKRAPDSRRQIKRYLPRSLAYVTTTLIVHVGCVHCCGTGTKASGQHTANRARASL